MFTRKMRRRSDGPEPKTEKMNFQQGAQTKAKQNGGPETYNLQRNFQRNFERNSARKQSSVPSGNKEVCERKRTRDRLGGG
jgi:hypothetical protein